VDSCGDEMVLFRLLYFLLYLIRIDFWTSVPNLLRKRSHGVPLECDVATGLEVSTEEATSAIVSLSRNLSWPVRGMGKAVLPHIKPTFNFTTNKEYHIPPFLLSSFLSLLNPLYCTYVQPKHPRWPTRKSASRPRSSPRRKRG
jgi:hypothetical protein